MEKSLEEIDNSIHNQCRIGNIEKVMEYIDEGGNPNVLDDDERTPLHWAASSGNPEVLSYLISIPSIQINVQDDFGTTPLMCAVASGKIENVRILLEAGADVNLEDENGETILLMVKRQADILKLIIPSLQNINKQNAYGMTALMKAASIGCMEILTTLLDNGADLSLKDIEGNTAAHFSAFNTNRDAYVLLVQRGYDEDTRNKENKTALDYVSNVCKKHKQFSVKD